MKKSIVPILLLFLSFYQIKAQTIFSNVQVVDVVRGKINPFQAVFVENGIISEIKPFKDLTETEKEASIDFTGHFVMPGMVDGHIHLFQSGGLYTRPDVIDLRDVMPYEEEKQWLRNNVEDLLKRYVRVGVTSVMDIGGPAYQLKMRDNLKENPALPNLWMTGPLVSTYQPEAFNNDEPPIIKVDSAEQAKQLVAEMLPLNPDFIKIWYIVFPGQPAETNLPIIQATIDTAHANGLKVAVHATQLQTARLAVLAGADILVHSVSDKPVDDEFVQLLVDSQTIYIPTLFVTDKYGEVLGQNLKITEEDIKFANPHTLGSLMDLRHLPESKMIADYKEMERSNSERAAKMLRLRQDNLKKLFDAGVIVATGTDAGNIGTLHASSYFEELQKMSDAGLTNTEVLIASTINGAKILGHEDELGTIDIGKNASMVFYKKNPLHDLNALKDPLFVYHNDKLIELDTFIQDTPENLAQKQLNAYNLKHVDAFVNQYDTDVRLFQYPSRIMYGGTDQMRETYSEMFEKYPNLHCELVNRTVIGNKVIDHERITGIGSNSFEVAAIYLMDNGKIKEVRFISQ